MYIALISIKIYNHENRVKRVRKPIVLNKLKNFDRLMCVCVCKYGYECIYGYIAMFPSHIEVIHVLSHRQIGIGSNSVCTYPSGASKTLKPKKRNSKLRSNELPRNCEQEFVAHKSKRDSLQDISFAARARTSTSTQNNKNNNNNNNNHQKRVQSKKHTRIAQHTYTKNT